MTPSNNDLFFSLRKIDALDKREMLRENEQLDDATVVVNALKKQLAESEANNQNLQAYIVKLKESYMSTFGSGNESN